MPANLFHQLQHDNVARRLAYSQAGASRGSPIFICLPGLLETRDVFAPLLTWAQDTQIGRVIAVDYCGRGASDPLEANHHYAMSIYLDDLVEFIEARINEQIKEQVSLPKMEIYLVGTSMGGILAMHLSQILKFEIKGLILNDIGLSLSWMSIYGLYKTIDLKQFKLQISGLPVDQRIDPRAIDDVGSKHHFDLEYDYDWSGMHFERLMKSFLGDVLLLHNTRSPICGLAVARKFKAAIPRLHILSLDAATHPANWTAKICAWIATTLHLLPLESSVVQGQPFEPLSKNAVNNILDTTFLDRTENAHRNTQDISNPLILVNPIENSASTGTEKQLNSNSNSTTPEPQAPTKDEHNKDQTDNPQRGSTHASIQTVSLTERISEYLKTIFQVKK